MATRSKRLPENLEETNSSLQEVNEIELLHKMIKDLKNQVDELKLQPSDNDAPRELVARRDLDIRPDDYIKVVSLCPYKLNLSTRPRGEGRIFGFSNFGEVKRIRYSDLVDILEVHDKFLKDGFFAILDKDVIQKHDLESDYGSILTKENIDAILDGNQSDAVTLFKVANEQQRELIVLMFVDKIVKNEEINLNFLDRISRVVGYSIHERALRAKEQRETALNDSSAN